MHSIGRVARSTRALSGFGCRLSVSARCHEGLSDDESAEEVLGGPLGWVPDPPAGHWLEREKSNGLSESIREIRAGPVCH